jgi:hypothetical protein
VLAWCAGAAAAQGPAGGPPPAADPPAPGWKTWPTNPPPAPPVIEPPIDNAPSTHVEAKPALPVIARPQAPAPDPIAVPAPARPSPPPAAAPVRSVLYQTPTVQDKTLPGTPPTAADPVKADVFRLDNNAVLEARIRAYIGRPDLKIPPLPDLAKGKAFEPRTYPPAKVELEPGFVVHGRLLFEEKNAERYGWEMGVAQPFLSAAYFYRDCLFLPYKVATNPHECYDTSAGKCLPGSPVPYYVYPPDFSWTGLAAEGAVVTGLVFIFP